jgi:inosose dehydratase
MTSRREFVIKVGAATAGALLPMGRSLDGLMAASSPPLYPPMDLSYFDTPVAPAPADIRFGYASITWGGDDLTAIEDVAAAGYAGIQLRSNVVKQFADKPGELRDILARHHLTLVALSSGGVNIDPAAEASVLEEHTKNARFVHDVGGLYLQVTDNRPKGRPIVPDDYARLGRLMTEIGKRTSDLGISLAYHNHMGSLGEKPEEVDRIFDAADPRYVKMELDTAHYQQGGGDPVKAVRKYGDRHLFLHLKDLEGPVHGSSGDSMDSMKAYRFVELGRGKVDFKGIFAALHDVKFRGWGIVELDSVPDKARTPKESALISKRYLEELGMPLNPQSEIPPSPKASREGGRDPQ